MEKIPEFPVVDPLLIKALEDYFNVQYPSLHDEDRKIWYRGGQLSVINFLKQHLEQQKRG